MEGIKVEGVQVEWGQVDVRMIRDGLIEAAKEVEGNGEVSRKLMWIILGR